MDPPHLSVVIPTRDRVERLEETLAALAEQGAGVSFEVVVVDDGSSDATPELLGSDRCAALGLRWQRQERAGPAAARNRAIAMARADRVLLLGDDTRPAPGALEAHLTAAAGREVAVQGHVDWDPEAPITPVMRFLAPQGPQFYFKGLESGEPIPYTAVLGSNLSAPTAWFRDDPFDEGFPGAALEDTELAYRWRRKARHAIYARQALCWHHHHYETLEPFLERQRRAGRAARHAIALHSRLAWPVVVEPALFGVWVLLRHALRSAAGQQRSADAWDLRCRRAFLRGFVASGRRGGLLTALRRPVLAAGARLRYRAALLLRRPAGEYSYHPERRAATSLAVDVKLAAEGPSAVTAQAAVDWCARQTLWGGLTATGYRPTGEQLWRVDRHGELGQTEPTAAWFMAPGDLPEVYPAFVESAALVAAAEDVDAVALVERLAGAPIRTAADVLTAAGRPYTLFNAAAYAFNPAASSVRPTAPRQRVKLVEDGGVAVRPRDARTFHRRRRGPYLSSRPLPARLRVGIRDVADLERAGRPRHRPSVLVTAPFLARGGAEHTLFETLKMLRADFELTIVTLAPHRRELGDRREDFHQVTERIYCLGDLVHPAAMPGILQSIVKAWDVEILYNANSTTLFYDFLPRLKRERPGLRIVDHLYDHRVGYIERYEDPGLMSFVDACVAENRRIAEVLVEKRGWPAERVPVIWPCGRPRDAFPADPGAARREVRRELGIADGDFVVLTAARMHPQKRPLDLVALAHRVRHLPAVRFLIAGGGELEGEVDAAIAAAPEAPIRRLPFRTDVPRLITAADAGCLVSEYEGLPVFLLECLQAGRPFLGTDVGDMGALLKATGAGHVVERPGDLDALEAGVRRLYDPTVRAELGARALRAAEDVSVERCAARYSEALLGSGRAAVSQGVGTGR